MTTKTFGPVAPLDTELMKQWLAEDKVLEVEVYDTDLGEFMQRVGSVSPKVFGVKKRFQKAPKK